MTAIVGLVENGSVYLGADSAISSGWCTYKTNLCKIIVKGKVLIAHTGSPRARQIVEFNITLEEQTKEQSDEAYIVFIADTIRESLKECGHSTINNNQEGMGDAFIVAYKGNIYGIAQDFQVFQYTQPFLAHGSGADHVEAVMYAMADLLPPRERITRAIETAAHFMPGSVGGSVVIFEQEI